MTLQDFQNEVGEQVTIAFFLYQPHKGSKLFLGPFPVGTKIAAEKEKTIYLHTILYCIPSLECRRIGRFLKFLIVR